MRRLKFGLTRDAPEQIVPDRVVRKRGAEQQDDLGRGIPGRDLSVDLRDRGWIGRLLQMCRRDCCARGPRRTARCLRLRCHESVGRQKPAFQRSKPGDQLGDVLLGQCLLRRRHQTAERLAPLHELVVDFVSCNQICDRGCPCGRRPAWLEPREQLDAGRELDRPRIIV